MKGFLRRSISDASGFALLEVLISMLLFSIAILGMVGLQAKATQISVDSEDRNRAALLANEMVAVMWEQQTTDSTTLSSQIGAWETRVANASVSGLPNASGSVSTSAGVATVSITWKAPWNKGLAWDSQYSTKVEIP